MIDTQAVSTSSTTNTQKSNKTILGKDDFFKLLLAQLKHQNPLNPLDGTDFAVQLAQFSSVEQLTNIGAEIKAQSERQDIFQRAGLASVVGREITANNTESSADGSGGGQITGTVTGIRWEKNEAYLLLPEGEVSLKNVVSIR